MKYQIKLNGTVYEVEVVEGNAQILAEYDAINAPAPKAEKKEAVAEAATATPVQAGAKTVNSPLPGLLVDVKVKVGQNVKKGEVVAVVEAMKMENDIVATDSGVVCAINATKGAQIASGAAIITLG